MSLYLNSESAINNCTDNIALLGGCFYAFGYGTPPSGTTWQGDCSSHPWKILPIEWLIDPYWFLHQQGDPPVRVNCETFLANCNGQGPGLTRGGSEGNADFAKRLLVWKLQSEAN